ncbi:DUF2946 family protein [Sphingomonas profundi]|uniref:DUF2946 family protein n=1 Tax=Alterirhizorhabdus profundi TaxID=2681549 RepID=UPI0012E89342|nr:DUF2946 family protein [Sphingomonas profundi]
MTALRRHLLRHRLSAGWLIALALMMKLLVPTGYMTSVSAGTITIELCSGTGPMKMTPVRMTMPGMAHHSGKGDHARPDMPCAFSALAAPSLGGADPLILAGAIAFILLTVFRAAVRPAPPAPALHLRPPLRGPPAIG